MSDGKLLVPFICEPVEIDGYHYLDGSIIDSIPVERAVEKGCDKIVVVLTKPEGSKPTDYSKVKKLIEWSYKKYPELCDAMAHRRQAYDRQDKFMKKLVEEGKVLVIRPEEQMIRHFENNNEKLLQCYQYGYDTMRKQLKHLRSLWRTNPLLAMRKCALKAHWIFLQKTWRINNESFSSKR